MSSAAAAHDNVRLRRALLKYTINISGQFFYWKTDSTQGKKQTGISSKYRSEQNSDLYLSYMLLIKITISSYDYLRPGLKVIKLFSYSTQLRTKFILLISMINTTSEYLKSRKISVFQHFCFYEQLKFYTELSMKKVLQPRGLSSVSANKICVYPQQYTIKCGSSNQKKWPLSCHFFWCKLTPTFQLKQLEAYISLVLNVGHFYQLLQHSYFLPVIATYPVFEGCE